MAKPQLTPAQIRQRKTKLRKAGYRVDQTPKWGARANSAWRALQNNVGPKQWLKKWNNRPTPGTNPPGSTGPKGPNMGLDTGSLMETWEQLSQMVGGEEGGVASLLQGIISGLQGPAPAAAPFQPVSAPSVGGGGGMGGMSGMGSAMAGAQFDVPISQAQTALADAKLQATQNVADLERWYGQGVTTATQGAAANTQAFEAAQGNLGAIDQGLLASVAGSPEVAAALSGAAAGNEGTMAALAANQSSFDQNLKTAIESQKADSIRIENVLTKNQQNEIQRSISDLQRQKGASAAAANAEISIAQMENSAQMALANAQMQADIALANSQGQMAQQEFSAAQEQNRMNNLLGAVGLLAETGSGATSTGDLINQLLGIQTINTTAGLFPGQVAGQGLQNDAIVAGIGQTQAATAQLWAQTELMPGQFALDKAKFGLDETNAAAQIEQIRQSIAESQARTQQILQGIRQGAGGQAGQVWNNPGNRSSLGNEIHKAIIQARTFATTPDPTTGKRGNFNITIAYNMAGDLLRRLGPGFNPYYDKRAKSMQNSIVKSIYGNKRWTQFMKRNPKSVKVRKKKK